MTHDLSLPLASGPWSMDAPEPTTVIVFWPGPSAPEPSVLIEALPGATDLGGDGLGDDDGGTVWRSLVRVPQLARELVLWCEPARPMAPGELGDPAAEACAWVIGVQTVLEPDDATGSYRDLVRTLAGAWPAVPALLDVNTTLCHRRDVLEQVFFDDRVDPPADLLWIIQAVQSTGEPATVWLHTHGLARCGCPELEMLQVPRPDAEAGAALLNELAQRLLEEPPPPPGEPLAVGPELSVILRPWQEVVAEIDRAAPGGRFEREGDDAGAHTGMSAVVCGPGAEICPRGVLSAVRRGDAVVYRARRATARQAALAGATWRVLRDALRAWGPRGEGNRGIADIHVQVGMIGPDGADREHVWVRLERADGDRLRGRLIHAVDAARGLRAGDEIEIERDDLSDWRVVGPSGTFGPEQAAALGRRLEPIPPRAEPS